MCASSARMLSVGAFVLVILSGDEDLQSYTIVTHGNSSRLPQSTTQTINAAIEVLHSNAVASVSAATALKSAYWITYMYYIDFTYTCIFFCL